MSDLLSASSLYLAVLGLLYSAWYSEIGHALTVKVPSFKEDRDAVIEVIRHTLRAKALPLALGSVVLSAILAPDAIQITIDSLDFFLAHGTLAFGSYDAVGTLYVAITMFTFALTMHMISLIIRLRQKLKKLKT